MTSCLAKKAYQSNYLSCLDSFQDRFSPIESGLCSLLTSAKRLYFLSPAPRQVSMHLKSLLGWRLSVRLSTRSANTLLKLIHPCPIVAFRGIAKNRFWPSFGKILSKVAHTILVSLISRCCYILTPIHHRIAFGKTHISRIAR